MDSPADRGEKLSRWFSLFRVAIWLLMIPIAILFGWISAVAFVSACSLYANAASDFASYRADSNKRLERIEEAVERIEQSVKSRS